MRFFSVAICGVVALTASVAAEDGVFGKAVQVPGVAEKGESLAVEGNVLYCGAGGELAVFDISKPLQPRLLSKVPGFGQLRQLAVEGGWVAVSSRSGGAWLVDARDPAKAHVASHFETVEQATGIELAGDVMFVGQRATGVEFVDISNRSRPEHIRMVKTPESQTVVYEDGYLYSGDWHAGETTIIDASDLAEAKVVASTHLQGLGDGLDLDGPRIFASTGHHRLRGKVKDKLHPDNVGMGHGLEIWDRSDVLHPKFVSRVQFPKFWRVYNDMWTVRESAGWAFCADTYNGLFAVDVRDAAAPRLADRFCVKDPADAEAPSLCVSSVALADGVVYATTLGKGLWAIPCQVAKARGRVRGRVPVNLKWREAYRTDSTRFDAWRPPRRGAVHSVAAKGGLYYVGCSTAGAYIVDANLKTVGEIPCGYARDLCVRGDRLYVAQGDEGLGVYSLADPLRPREIARIREFAPGVTRCEWIVVPTDRWAVVTDRRHPKWYFMDLEALPNAKCVQVASSLNWVKTMADFLVGGKWLGYAETHSFVKWFDLSGDVPRVIDTENKAETGPLGKRTNVIRWQAGCCAFQDRLLIANDGGFVILNPAQDRNADGSPWQKYGYANKPRLQIGGVPVWDGANKVLLSATAGRELSLVDLSSPTRPQLLWKEKTVGYPENAIFADGRFLVPCGYQGLLRQKLQCPPPPGPEAWTFKEELARPVVRQVPEKFALDDQYGLSGDLETVRDDLKDFLGGTRTLRIVRGKVDGPESHRVEVAPDAVTLVAENDAGVRRAVYWFEDRVIAGDLRPIVRKPWLRHRISRCFFGPIKRAPFFRDELMDDVDYYPAAYLNRLAHEAVNGLWLTVEFRDLVGTRFSSPREGHERRLAKLRRTVAQCRRYGIGTWLFAIEPHAVETNDVFYLEHPELFPVPRSWQPSARLMCASDPRTAEYLRECTANIFREVPDLAGLLLITHGERDTTCFSLVNARKDGVHGPCAACARLEPWRLHENVVGAMAAGMRSVRPQAELISWFYQPWVQAQRADWVYEAARHMPPGVSFLYNFESGCVRDQLGRLRPGGDYWLSFTGPSESFARVAANARAAGVDFGAKIQVGNSHEDATVPFVPVPGLLHRKYAAMRRAGCSRVMQCWYFGNYPGIMNEAAGALAFEDFADGEDAFLERLARPAWGKDAAAMARVWRALSDAYAEYPLSNDMQYYGPFHAGVVWPLLPDVALSPLGRTWKPEDPPSGDAIGECLENHTLEEALVLAERMASGAASACDVDAWRARWAGNRERLLDLGVIRTLQLQFAAARDVFAFYQARSQALFLSRVRGDASGARAAVRQMRAAVEREIDVTRSLIPFAEADSRLGFHSEAEQHQFFPAKLRWREGELRAALVRIDAIDAALARGQAYPESAFERSAPSCRVDGDWVELEGVRFRAVRTEGDDLVLTVEKEGTEEFVLETFDAAGTLFARQIRVGPEGLRVTPPELRNVVTPEHEATVRVERNKKGFRAEVRLSALGWRGDGRLRPGWLRVLVGATPVWPALDALPYRLNLGHVRGDHCGRLIW